MGYSESITTPSRMVYGTFFNVVTLVCNAAIGFFLIRFLLDRLGEARYGVWLLVGGGVFHYGGLLSMGLSSSINRYIPVYLARGDQEGVRRVVSVSLFFFSLIGVVLAIATLVVYLNIGSWFAIEPELVGTAEALLLVVGLCFAAVMPLQLAMGVLSGVQRYDIMNLAILVPLIVRTVLIVVLLSRGYGLLTLGIIFGASEITMRMLQTVFIRKWLPKRFFSISHIDFGLLREMLAYGANTFLYAAGAIIIYYASNLVLGVLVGTPEISQFSTAMAPVLLLAQFLQAFTAAIKPAVSDLDARQERLRVKELAFLTQKYSLLILIPGVCFLAAMGGDFLEIWVRGSFSQGVLDTMGGVLTILAVGHCIRLAQHSNFLVLAGRGEHKIFGVLMALTALLCVAGSVISVGVFDWGLVGIAWANFVPMVLMSGVILPIYFNWKMKISTRDSITRVWWPAVLGGMPGVVVIGLWKYVSAPNSWAEILAVVVVTAGLTVASSWFLSLGPTERRRFAGILTGRRSLEDASSAL